MNNYEKAKEEGINKIKEGLCRKYHLNETIVCGHLSNGEVIPWSQDMIVSVFSSFAEKIKEGVETDILSTHLVTHLDKESSDSQTIKE